MTKTRLILTASVAALIIGVAAPGVALDLGLGGANVTTGGSDTSIASATYDGGSTAGETGIANVNRQDGSLLTVDRSPGSTAGTVNLGRPGDTIATASGGTGSPGDQNGTLAITRQDGSLASLNSNGNSTNGSVNLGGAGGGLGGGGLGGGGLGGGGGGLGGGGIGGIGGGGAGGGGVGAGSGGGAGVAFATLPGPQQQAIVNRCTDVLARPILYEPDLLTLCRFLAQVQLGR